MTNYLCNIRFKVLYETTNPNQTIKVVGNVKELGNWSIDKAIPLFKSQVEKNVWTSNEILLNKKSLLPNTTQNYFKKKVNLLDSNKSDSFNNSFRRHSMLNTPLSSEKSKIDLDIIFEDDDENSQVQLNLKKLEYKYLIFVHKDNKLVFSHWEDLPKNANHLININELQFSHVLLINSKFKIFTCVESGLKFKFNLPEESTIEYNDTHYSYNLEKMHNFIQKYIQLYKKTEKNDIMQIRKKLTQVLSKGKLGSSKEVYTLLKANSTTNLKDDFFDCPKKSNEEKSRENTTLLEKMLLYSKSREPQPRMSAKESREFERSYLLQNFTVDEKIQILKDKLKEIQHNTKIILASVYLPCKVFIDASSIKTTTTNEFKPSDVKPRLSHESVIFTSSKKIGFDEKENVCDNLKQNIRGLNDLASCSSDNQKGKIDLYKLKFGISFFEDSFSNNFTNILERSIFGYKKTISFNWVGYLINYYDILDQLGLRYPKSPLQNDAFSNNSCDGENEAYDEEEIQIVNSKLEDLLRKHNMTFIKIGYDSYLNFKKAVADYLEPLMNFIKYLYDLERILNYDKCWEALKNFNYNLAETINSLSSNLTDGGGIEEENTIVIVQDMPICLVPSYLQNFYKKFKIAFWLFNNFPSADVFRSFPNRTEILKSILKSNLVGFNTYSSSRNFITAVKKVLNLNYCSNQNGQLLFNISGREIFIDVQSITTDKENIYELLNSREFQQVNLKIRQKLDGKKFIFLSIDPWLYLTGARHKIMAFKLFLENIKDKNLHSKIKYIQMFHTSETYITNIKEKELVEANFLATEKLGNEINKEFGMEIILVKKYNEISLIEKLAYFTNSNCYIKLARREPFNTDVYDFVLTKEIQFENLNLESQKKGKNLKKEFKVFDSKIIESMLNKNPDKTFCIMLSETNEACTSLNSSLKANQFDTMQIYNNFLDIYNKITNPSQTEFHQILNDIRITEKNSITNWLMNLIYKLININDKGKSLIKKGYGLNMSLIQNISKYTPLNEEDVIVNYSNSYRRLIIFDAETSFISKRNEITKLNLNFNGFEDDNEDLPQYFYQPYSKIINKLKDIANDPKNILIIISSRTRHEMDLWFKDLNNAILVAEMGFFVKMNFDVEKNSLHSLKIQQMKKIRNQSFNITNNLSGLSFSSKTRKKTINEDDPTYIKKDYFELNNLTGKAKNVDSSTINEKKFEYYSPLSFNFKSDTELKHKLGIDLEDKSEKGSQLDSDDDLYGEIQFDFRKKSEVNNYIMRNKLFEVLEEEENNQIRKLSLGLTNHHQKIHDNINSEEKYQSKNWNEFIENTQLSWIDEVMFQLKPYVYKCEGSYLVQNETHIIWNYQNSDTVQAYSFIKAIYNEFETPLKQINVVIENISNCLYFKLNIISKANFVNFFLYNLVESCYEPNVIIAMGGDTSFERVYLSLKNYEKLHPYINIFSCNIGEKVSNAKYYLNNKKEAYLIIKNVSKLSIPELKSNLGKTVFSEYEMTTKDFVSPRRHKSCKLKKKK